MKKWIASILCLVMVLSSISALAALPAPDKSKKPAEVSVTITKDSEGYLNLKVSDGGKEYDVSGRVETEDSSRWVSFTWDDEKNAYVSDYSVSDYSGSYDYINVNSFNPGQTVYRQIGGEDYMSYVRLDEYKYKDNQETRNKTTWYEDGSIEVSSVNSVYDSKGREVSETSESARYNKDGELKSSTESETKSSYAENGRTDTTTSKEISSDESVTERKGTWFYPSDGSASTYTEESTTRTKDGALSRTSSRSRDKNGNTKQSSVRYNTATGAVTDRVSSAYNDKAGTYERAHDYYYEDGSLRMKEASSSVSKDDVTTETETRYNSKNELVYKKTGKSTETDDGTSWDYTYTNASGAKIGWDTYDAKTGKESYKKPAYFDQNYNPIDDSQNDFNSTVRSGDVSTWKEYSYDPATGKESTKVTNYKGLKIYEAELTNGEGTRNSYWLRTQKPYEVTTSKDGKTERVYKTTRDLEWSKEVEAYTDGVYTESYYNSLGELTYKYENGKYYVNKAGKLEELEDGLEVNRNNRYMVTGFEKRESIENGYKYTYYDLDKKVTGSYEHTNKDGVSTSINYDQDGQVTRKEVTESKDTDTGYTSKTTVNDVVTRISESKYEDDIETTTEKEYDEKTGMIQRESTSVNQNGKWTEESKSYDSKGNLSYIYRSESQGNGITALQELDGNGALIMQGTSQTVQGTYTTKEYWAVGTLAYDSSWYYDGLRMGDSVGTSSSYDEIGRYTYWTTRDADGNESTWDYYAGDQVGKITDVNYNADGSKSTHVQAFNEDGTTDYWEWTDETEDGQYSTQKWWDGNSVLLWTKVTEATKEGNTITITDPYGNKVVEKYNLMGDWVSTEKNYLNANGWKYAFGDWKYIENGQELQGEWKNVNGTWYYFNWNGDMATSNIAFYKEDENGNWKPETAYAFYEDGTWAGTPGWAEVSDDTWSYIQADGTAAFGWQKLGGTWYYFSDAGYMMTGNVYVDGTEYHLDENGAWIQLNGWLQDEDTGLWKHYSNDVKDTGWYGSDGAWYYLSGATGSMVSDTWLELDDKWYLFDESGLMETGWAQKNGTWYYFENSGALADGWVQSGDTWYYMTENGMATGWQEIDGKWEFFNADGTWGYTWTE